MLRPKTLDRYDTPENRDEQAIHPRFSRRISTSFPGGVQ
jgi:hypothetical protein